VMVRQQLATKGIRFQATCPPNLWVVADQEQMRLVLLNLLLNAVEAVSTGGSIKVRAGEAEEKGKVSVSVIDDGTGVEPENLEQIFEPYFTMRDGGTGLGLALVRRIVDEHGGKVQAANNPEGGLKLEFSLPAEET